ncbi:hypothetical protein Ccrd_003782 [Cynara cardunculus var. scolymus]|uniref:STAR protein homodimerisation region domain-containing protein n=1 Tax=Cynara cardunculus var. scolymus TaxID=59895 RepID=A0A103XNX0_CYNCS|nr:hypothetical protein Ccrd_003782 [Cynara cardunculus var. scolymus]
MSSLYGQNFNFSPARAPSSPHIWANPDVESTYLGELLEEKLKLAPFMRVLPICSKLLNQGFNDYDRLQRGSPSPLNPSDVMPDIDANGLIRWNGNAGWSPLQHERLGMPPGLPMDHWNSAPASPSSFITKRILRLDIPVNNFPNEESLRGRPGYEHLNEPLHILIEAELPASIIDVRLRQAQEIIEELLKPVDESQDLYKRQQLRELAMLNSNFREDSPQPRGSMSPFGSSGMKRAKTGW